MPRKPKADAEYGEAITSGFAGSGLPNQAKVETRGRKKGAPSVAEIQAKSLELFGEGLPVASVMAKLGRTPQTYQVWRSKTPGYAEKVDRIRARLAGAPPEQVGDFGAWREKYLGRKTFPHMWQWVDLLEGRDPRELDERQVFRKGSPNRILCNTFPNSAKSTTMTMDYSVYRICQDPNVRILVVSQTRDMAKKMLLGIKDRLTHPRHQEMHADFGPPGGFAVGAAQWNDTRIYVGNRDTTEKDPTVEALGSGGQIYGARADLIILDDVISMKTCRTKGQRDKLLEWIRTEVLSRLEPQTGRLLIVGTRLTNDDLYQEIVRQDDRGVWTYLTQPAVLEWGETPDKHRTLWPERFNGYRIEEIMADHGTDQARFRLVYQQEQAAEDAVFPAEALRGVTYPGGCGYLPENVRANGMQGLYVVAGLDPAASGHTAIVVLGLDKRTKVRYVLDVYNQRGWKPHMLREKMIDLTRRYRINEWRIEKNGLQTLLSQDRDLRVALLGLGSRIHEHHTVTYGQSGKWDADFGVATLAPLFLGALEVPPAALIAVPYNGTHRATRELLEQLEMWEPNTQGKTDIVMALWFAELGCRKQLETQTGTHASNRWQTKGQADRQRVVNIQDYLDAQAAAGSRF